MAAIGEPLERPIQVPAPPITEPVHEPSPQVTEPLVPA